MARLEVNWTKVGEDGEKRQLCAHRKGDAWEFFTRAKRFDDWQPLPSPPLEDWLELLDAVKRREGRHLAKPGDARHLAKRIREIFPEAKVEG